MSSPEAKPEKKSFFKSWSDRKKSVPISDEDILKYTGKTREEFDTFRDSTPGVGGNRLAGTLAVGNSASFIGIGAGEGVGGWGPAAGASGPNRGLKFPPGQAERDAAEAKAKAKSKEAALAQDSD